MVLSLKAPSIPCSDPARKSFLPSGFTGAGCVDVGSDAGCLIAAGLKSGALVRCEWAGAEFFPTHQRMVVESRRWLCLVGDCFKFCVFILPRPQQCCTAVSELPRVQNRRSDADLQEGSYPIKCGQRQSRLHNTCSLVLPLEKKTNSLLRKPLLNVMYGFVAFDLEERDLAIIAPEIQWSTL